jgi:hypothetical protein
MMGKGTTFHASIVDAIKWKIAATSNASAVKVSQKQGIENCF